MCLLLVAHDCCAGYRLVVAANRDEFHDRPTAPAARWDDHPGIIGGRDLEAGGTWLALDQRGRFATITNVRSGRALPAGARSRGLIVNDYLFADVAPDAYASALARHGNDYAGFNLLAYDNGALCWYSNQAGEPQRLDEGIYTLSNAALDTAWPKSERLRAGFAALFDAPPSAPVDALLHLLRDGQRADDDALPDTGIGHAMERVLSSIFIEGEGYGTRCSTVILIDDAGQVTFHERRYDRHGEPSGDTRIGFELPPGRA